VATTNRIVFIDPSYSAYYEDRLFDTTNPELNRDDTLTPFDRLRTSLCERNVEIHTADYLLAAKINGVVNDYYSLGLLCNYKKLIGRQDVRLRGFFIMEPPVTAPKLYRALPELTRHFERVYLHNTLGDGYSLKDVDQSKLYSFYWPQPYKNVLESYWNNRDRQHRIVVINGNHIPRSLQGQLYGKRIEVMARLAKLGVIDLYGRGWDKWWSHRSMWPPYWLNYKALMSIYHGPCESKYEVLSQYSFSLCFENMTMNGYITEKIFDCLYAGTIPLYLGAKNIDAFIPPEVYVDCRHFDSWEDMCNKVMAMSVYEVNAMREAGRSFIQSEAGEKYYDSLVNIFTDTSAL
jgi:hypothetical protein